MRPAAASVLLSLVATVASAEVAVRVSGGRVDLTATAAPLADVLDRLARQTGMKVVYEGPAPRQLVTVSLHGRTPAETILAVFEGLGLNYAMVADATGAGVQTLMVAGAASAASSSGTAAATRPNPPGVRRPFGPPPGSSPEGVDPGFEEGEQESEANDVDFTGMPQGAEAQDAGGAQQPGAQPANVPPVNPGAAQQGAPPPAPPQPAMPFSASPFTPQPQPFTPPQAEPHQPTPQQGEENKPQSAPPQ